MRGEIRSERTPMKLRMLKTAVTAQIEAYRLRHPRRRILLIDGNAGDGAVHQLTTPELLSAIAARDGNADVVLCEKEFEHRAQLQRRFPGACILRDNAEAPFNLDRRHRWALWLSDPCGPSGHGCDAMAMLAAKIPSDFVVAFNEQLCLRSQWQRTKTHLVAMLQPEWWQRLLQRKRLSRTHVISISNNFQCRVIVLANRLGDETSRSPFRVVS
jgi:hypothetical protein